MNHRNALPAFLAVYSVIACNGDPPTGGTRTSSTSSSTSTTTTTVVACSPTLTTETVRFSLPPASQAPSVELGPFPVGEGRLDGNLAIPRGYIMCACVGPAGACIPFCGPGPNVGISIEVPRVFPPGDFFGTVYYNTNFRQPEEGASGELRLTFVRHCSMPA